MSDFDDWMKAQEPAPAPPPKTEYKTTTATTPAQLKKEEGEKRTEMLQSGLASDRLGAAGRALASGATLNLLPYAKAEGEQYGEDFYRMLHGQPLTANRDVEREVLQDEVGKNRQAARDYPLMYPAVEAAGSLAPALLIPGSRAASASRAGLPLAEGAGARGIASRVASRGIADTEANIVAQNALSGAASTGSTDPLELSAGAAGGVLAGKALGAVADRTVGKMFEGAMGRQSNNLIKDILRNERTDITVSKTARKRFYEKASSALDEVKADKELRRTIQRGDSAEAARLARNKLDVISEPRDGLYSELDSIRKISFGEIDTAIRKAERTATESVKDALVAMRNRLNNDWLERWTNTGMAVTRDPKLAEKGLVGIAIKGKGVREWLTKAQNQADMVIGGLEEGPRKEVKDALEDVAHEVWKRHLDKVAKTHPDLISAIRQYDKRASGLIAIEKVMKRRAPEDFEGRMGLGKRAEKAIDKLAGTSAIAGLAMGRTEPLLALASWEAVKKLPRAGRAVNDSIVVPIQRAAMEGKPWGEVLKYTTEKGIPQALARGAFDSGVKMYQEHLENKRREAASAASGGSSYYTSTETSLEGQR